MASVAADAGDEACHAYPASKSALLALTRSMALRHGPRGVRAVVIAPGFIDTPINQDVKSRPFLIDPADGAKRIADLIEKNVRRTTVPVWPWTAIGWLMRSIPDAAWARFSGGLHRGRR